MLPKISLLKCILLLNLSTIQTFNVIMMKDLNENQLVNKLTEIANQGKYDNTADKNVNSISVRSQRKTNPSDSTSEEDQKEENNDQVEEETDKSNFNVQISNITMKKHTENKHEDAINPETSSETMDNKPIKRTKKHKKNNHKNKVETSKDDGKPNISRTIKNIWNTLRGWFRRNDGSGNEKVMSLIDDQNLIDVMKRIIIIMRASENSGESPNNQELIDTYILRTERSGEDNDPLAPGKLPINLISLFTSTDTPKTMWYKPNSFWNYWTYPKGIFTDNCKGEGLIQHGNLCIDSLGH